MQLSTLVLPAPLGPISASSSPRSTEIDTSSSTTRPPKRRPSLLTSSSAIPPPAPAILLDLAIAAPVAAGRLAEIEFLDVDVSSQPCGVTVEHDTAILQHITVIGDRERRGGALLHHQD